MSHQTGIRASDELCNFFGRCKNGNIRVFRIQIQDEYLVLDKYQETRGSWENDYDQYILSLVEDKQPCYIFYRLDSQNESGFEWIFISWSPDNSPIRQKMLYASTKATLKKEFGGNHIKHELFGTHKDDINLLGYYKHIHTENAPVPLTNSEEELRMIRCHELGADIGVYTKQQTIQGIALPISDDAINALFDMKDGHLNYVQLSIDMDNEEINLETVEDTDIQSLGKRLPLDHARYHLFSFPHTYEGDYIVSIVFIYSVPGYSCSVRERMLYSSCKSPLLEVIENRIGIELSKKIEVDSPLEITEEFLKEEIHPKTNIHKQKFAKPKGPSNRGTKRLIRSQNDESILT